MLVIVFAALWLGYSAAFHGWTIWQNYDITYLQSISPAGGGYSGQWPPPPIPSDRVLPTGKGGGGTSSTSSNGGGGPNPKGLSVGQLANPKPSSRTIPTVPGK